MQAVMAQHAEPLLAAGFCYPEVRPAAMFHAALEVTESHERWGFPPQKVAGTFDEVLEAGRASGATVVFSHEILGGARVRSIEDLKHRLSDFEVHVVLTVRDLGRVLAASWQEAVKNGAVDSFQQFAQQKIDRVPLALERPAQFWKAQNVEDTLQRWSAIAPPERTHVVLAPAPGAPRDELWKRFSSAVGLPDGVVDLGAVERDNESLGMPQVALLRQVNAALGDRVPQPGYSRVVKRWFAQELLAAVETAKPVTPPEVAAAFEPVAERWQSVLAEGGYRVYGDLEDLRVRAGAPDAPHPDDVSAEEVLAGMPEVLAGMLVRVRDQNRNLAEEQRRAARTATELRQRLEEAENRPRRLWRS